MKHLKYFKEKLYTSTYLSAAKKAKKFGHSKRKDDLEDWASIRGISHPVDKLYPHRFVFANNHTAMYFRDEVKSNVRHDNTELKKAGLDKPEDPYFSITEYKVKDDYIVRVNSTNKLTYLVNCECTFVSNFNKTLKLDFQLSGDYDGEGPTFIGKMSSDSESDRYFKFDRRVDAVQFKKFLLEEFIPDFLEEIEKHKSHDYESSDYIYNTYIKDKQGDEDFIYVDDEDIKSIYLGFVKDIPVNSFYKR